jgi:hypothetical protein
MGADCLDKRPSDDAISVYLKDFNNRVFAVSI